MWRCYSDKLDLANGRIVDLPSDNDKSSASFKFKQIITNQIRNDGTKDVKIMMPLSNFWRALELPLINCKINLILTCSAYDFIVAGLAVNQSPTFTITDTKPYVPVVTLSTQENAKLLQQLTPGFKRIINWNKYQSKATIQTWNQI